MSVRVLVSSTCWDLADERRALEAALYHMGCATGGAVVAFSAAAQAPREVHLEVVEHADVYVGVFGHCYGALDEVSGLSVTEVEYRRARERGIPCLIYLRSEYVPVRPAQIERDPAKRVKMESLKAELRNPASGNPTVYFDSPEDLASRVIRDIEHTLQDGSGRGRGAVAVGADRDEVVAAALMTLRGEGAGADAPAPVRAKAGRALARLGDPRREVTVPEATPFCRVPAGPFWMGSDAGDYECERPRHRADLPYDYYIARYPVTNAQYQAFCDAGGYAVAAYWREATREGYWADGALFNDCGGAIGGYGEPFDLPNHPLAGIPWYGAVAYGRWLGERLAAMGGRIPVWDPARDETALRQVAGLAVRLPTEREWEKAARGPDGLIYPWGDAPDPERANYDETGIAATSAVGCFPGSASPYGAQGMSGNVWEWCASKWRARYADGEEDNDPWGNDRRVVRGGSFCYEADGVHGAARSWELPDLGAGYVGFRVVAVGARDDVAS